VTAAPPGGDRPDPERAARPGAGGMRRPKDRDFVETVDGLFFCLVGYLHPPDRYTAYLKYAPAPAGKWARGAVSYRRELPYYHVRHVVTTLELLQKGYPRYVWTDPASSLTFSFVPRDAVRRYYLPEARLAEILAGPGDPLEAEVADLVRLLTRASALPPGVFGITGSVLLGLHNPAFSDIDLLVYGAQNTGRVKAAVEALRGGAIEALPGERRERWRAETAERFGLPAGDVAAIEARRWNYFLVKGRYVSIHPTRSDGEIAEAYGEHRYRAVGPATVEATVSDATESVFLPAVYRVADVRVLEGASHPVSEICSFEGLFCQIADAGDRIVATGGLEAREDGAGRLIVGTAAVPGGGAIRVLRPR
jgi:predicted nucleotidyltransferase